MLRLGLSVWECTSNGLCIGPTNAFLTLVPELNLGRIGIGSFTQPLDEVATVTAEGYSFTPTARSRKHV